MSERAYETSHPWLAFQHDFSTASRAFWMLLGAVQAKCSLVGGAPLLPEAAQEIEHLYQAKGIAATTAIEGNSLREEEVEAILGGRLRLPPSQQYLQREVENISRACNRIAKQAQEAQEAQKAREMRELFPCSGLSISPEDILEYNREVLQELELSEKIQPGKYRDYPVRVASYLGAPAEDCPFLVEKLVAMVREIGDPQTFLLDKKFRFASGILAAILSHLYIAWIHPFGDGNGRTARLLEFRILLETGVPIPAAHLLSNHYNKMRFAYYRHLQESSKRSDGVSRFVEYALQGFLDGLDELLGHIREEQMRTTWVQFVKKHFAPKKGTATLRKRELLLALAAERGPVSADVDHIRRLSPELSDAYPKKTQRVQGAQRAQRSQRSQRSQKMLSRDISALAKENFVTKKDGTVEVNTNLLVGFGRCLL